jgi:hypothetical protein
VRHGLPWKRLCPEMRRRTLVLLGVAVALLASLGAAAFLLTTNTLRENAVTHCYRAPPADVPQDWFTGVVWDWVPPGYRCVYVRPDGFRFVRDQTG